MTKKQSVPCYVRNGGIHGILNIPLGMFSRVRLLNFCKELLKSQSTLETFMAAKATEKNLVLIRGLIQILSLDLKPKENRREAQALTAAVEKNLKPKQRENGSEQEKVNLVQFAISCGLIALIYILAAHLEYLENLNY